MTAAEFPQLSPDQVREFVDRGYLVLRELVTPEEVGELLAEAVAIVRGRYPSEKIAPAPADRSDAEVLQSFLCIHQPHLLSPVLRSFLAHQRIAAVLRRIVGAHLAHWDGRVKCMQSMLFVKPPDSPGQAWHQDEIYIPTRDRSLCGAWLALDDATVANGCLWVIPGSHRTGYLYPQRPHNQPGEFDFAPESFGFDDSAEVPVEVPAGAVVFFNGYLLHRSRRNHTAGYRRALVNHYCNAWSLLPWWLKEGEVPANADRRNIVPVAGEDPYAWKGYEHDPNHVWIRPRA